LEIYQLKNKKTVTSLLTIFLNVKELLTNQISPMSYSSRYGSTENNFMFQDLKSKFLFQFKKAFQSKNDISDFDNFSFHVDTTKKYFYKFKRISEIN
jgi:hypothetical protein